MFKKLCIASLSIAFSLNSYAFLNKLPAEATSAVGTSLSEKLSQSDPRTELLTQKLKDIGLEKTEDQANWTNFVQDCIIADNLSADKVSSLMNTDTSGLLNFLKDFKVPDLKTIINDKIMACPHALPLMQNMLSKLSPSSTTPVKNK